jgi:hypothetical protein
MEVKVGRMVTQSPSVQTCRFPRPRRVVVLTLLVLFCFVAPAFSQEGATAAQADLDQLVERAQIIVRGQVKSVTIEPHPQFPNLQTVVITLSVTRVLKGAAGPTLIFRQFQWDSRDASNLAGYKGAGEVLLFLNPVSQYGLTSTVGLEQGHFRVLPDGKGNRYVVNGRANLGLFNQVPAKAAARGVAFSKPVQEMLANSQGRASLESFEEAVRTLAGSPK